MSITQRITEYLSSGGLVNPELAEHEKVRDLLIDCRKEIQELQVALDNCYRDDVWLT